MTKWAGSADVRVLIVSDNDTGFDVEPFLTQSRLMLTKVARWHDLQNPGLILTFRPDLLVEMGAEEVLRTSATGAALVQAVYRAATGRGEEDTLLGREGPANPADRLTPREHDVLGLVVAGRRNDEIAEALVINRKTVEFHVSHIMEKLPARSRTEAVTVALRLGLVTLDSRANRQ